MESSAPTIIPGIQEVAGPIQLGFLINCVLFGVLCVQVYIYYMAFPRDRIVVKMLVYGLFCIEAVQTAIIIYDAFYTFATRFGDPTALSGVQLRYISVPIVCGIVSFVVQVFFAYRISVLSGLRSLGYLICLIALVQCTAAIVAAIQAKIVGDFRYLQAHAMISVTLWLVGSAVCDILIAGLMCYFLSRRSTGFKTTQLLIQRLMRLTIETGTLTATVATIFVIVFLACQQDDYHIAPSLALAKLYSNTLLMVLNSRFRIIGGRDDSDTSELVELEIATNIASARTHRISSGFTLPRRSADHSNPNVIHITRTFHTDQDSNSGPGRYQSKATLDTDADSSAGVVATTVGRRA